MVIKVVFYILTNEHTTVVSGVDHLWQITNLRLWAENSKAEYKGEVLSKCNGIINQSHWEEKIIDTIKKHNDDYKLSCAVNAASRLEIDISAVLFDVAKSDPVKYA